MPIPNKSLPEKGLFWCSKCKALYGRESFFADKHAPHGLKTSCKKCASAAFDSWRRRNKEYVAAKMAEWRSENPEKVKANNRTSRKNNMDKVLARNREREIAEVVARAKWADSKMILNIYLECKRITRETGVLHHVDHIIPLKGKTVCGLHVESNLRIITADENLRKFNKLQEV